VPQLAVCQAYAINPYGRVKDQVTPSWACSTGMCKELGEHVRHQGQDRCALGWGCEEGRNHRPDAPSMSVPARWATPAEGEPSGGRCRATTFSSQVPGPPHLPITIMRLPIKVWLWLARHQSTVWRWNRAIYDPALGGHLRIEMRALPAGPACH
jgi:hypothetical protein